MRWVLVGWRRMESDAGEPTSRLDSKTRAEMARDLLGSELPWAPNKRAPGSISSSGTASTYQYSPKRDTGRDNDSPCTRRDPPVIIGGVVKPAPVSSAVGHNRGEVRLDGHDGGCSRDEWTPSKACHVRRQGFPEGVEGGGDVSCDASRREAGVSVSAMGDTSTGQESRHHQSGTREQWAREVFDAVLAITGRRDANP